MRGDPIAIPKPRPACRSRGAVPELHGAKQCPECGTYPQRGGCECDRIPRHRDGSIDVQPLVRSGKRRR